MPTEPVRSEYNYLNRHYRVQSPLEDQQIGMIENPLRSPVKKKGGSFTSVNMDESDKEHEYEAVGQASRLNQDFNQSSNPRKTANAVYDSVELDYLGKSRRTKPAISESSDDEKCDHSTVWQKRILVVLFFISVAGLTFSILMFLGILDKDGSPEEACKDCPPLPSSSALSDFDSYKFMNMVEQLQKNLTLANAKLAKMQNELEHVINDVDAVSMTTVVGPQGPRGYNGSDGKPGRDGKHGRPGNGDLGSCHYKSKTTSTTVDTTKEENTEANVSIQETKGYVIMGVTCSTEGGQEHNLVVEGNGRRYICMCGGVSTNSVSLVKTLAPQTIGGEVLPLRIIKCKIHYWSCPRRS